MVEITREIVIKRVYIGKLIFWRGVLCSGHLPLPVILIPDNVEHDQQQNFNRVNSPFPKDLKKSLKIVSYWDSDKS